MNVAVRPKRAQRSIRLGRRGQDQYGLERVGDARNQTIAGSRKRPGGPPQDRALYSCQCGFVFEAAVSTSVGCPNCGDPQAW